MAERTKSWIADSMKKLLVKKTIEEIRVSEICREAEIGRATFYYHFRDKYDVMAWMFFQDAFQTDLLSVASAAGSMNKMRNDFIFYKRAYEDQSQNPMWAYMLEYFAERYMALAREKAGGELDTQTRYSIRLYCYGALGMTREWLLKDNITPAETIVEMMFRSMPAALSELYFGRPV